MQYLLFIIFLCLCWAVLCWCVFKLITCNGSPLCRKWSLNSNPDRFWAKRRSLAKLVPTPCNPSPLPQIHLQTDFSLTWHHDIILIVCSKDTMRKMMLKRFIRYSIHEGQEAHPFSSQPSQCCGHKPRGELGWGWVMKTIKLLTWPTQWPAPSPLIAFFPPPPSLFTLNPPKFGSKCLSFTNKVMNNKSKGFLGTISLYLWHLKTVNGPCNCYWKQFHALAAGSQGDLRLRAPHVCQIFMPGLVKARSQKSSARPLSLSSDWHTWVKAK